MKPKQFYFEELESETCYTEDYFRDRMRDEGLDSMKAYKAEPIHYGGGIFWCKVERFCGGDSSDHCGKQCPSYVPRNGKSGCCVNHTTKMYTPGEIVTFKSNV